MRSSSWGVGTEKLREGVERGEGEGARAVASMSASMEGTGVYLGEGGGKIWMCD